MTDRARRLLDNLLGSNRNTILTSDLSEYCIYQMAGGCLYEILKNTKLSIGTCKYKIHEYRDSLDKVLYEQELLKILSDFFEEIDKKIKNCTVVKNESINEEEYKIDLKISKIEQNITEDNISKMYDEFLKLEPEIYNLEKIKEAFFVKNRELGMERCNVCGMNIIKNFCSKKFLSHVEGKAHVGVLKLREIFLKLKNKGL